MTSSMDKLIGRHITDVMLSRDQYYIIFTTDRGNITYAAEGDCCSRSWFESVAGVGALLNATVHTVDDVEMPSMDHPIYDSLQMYGVKITTDHGTAFIEFRNASNGYYGGYLNEVDSPPVGTLVQLLVDEFPAA